MEVHHHTSHAAGSGQSAQRKKWTHYVWEFLMLFLAVYLGFLVENIREHKIEHNRADKYIESFYEDLKTDTARINRLIGGETTKVENLSSFKSGYDSLIQGKGPASFLGIIKNSMFNVALLPEQRTIVQLANAGGYRLLKKEDADSITSYVQRCNVIDNYERTAYQQTQDNLRNLFNKVIDFSSNISLNKNLLKQPFPDADSVAGNVIVAADKSILNEYFNTLLQYIRVLVNHRNSMMRLKEKANGLIIYFKEKYGFD